MKRGVNMVAACLRIFSLLASSCSAFEWKECPNEHSEAQTIANVELHPEPVPVGTTAKFTIAGHSKVAVNDSKMKLSVYYLGLPVYHKTLDQPEAIKKGDFVSTFSEDFPSYTPPGTYKVTIESTTNAGELLTCLNVEFKVTWAKWSRALFSA